VRGMLSQLMEQADQLTVVDMEASIEHMSRGTVRHTDVMLVVTEPYYRSLETTGRAAKLAQGLGIGKVYVVANKVRSPKDEEAIRRYCAERDLEIVAVFPYDDDVRQADNAGTPVLDYKPQPAYVGAVDRLADRLLAGSASRVTRH
jgi:CO dehydrogenase maturation factor